MQFTYQLSEIGAVAQEVSRAISGHCHIAFDAPMGAGKTTFIKALCSTLGVTEEVNSPTFAIVNEYNSPRGAIYHFDFYRVRTPQEALDFGFYDYLDSGNLCLMEWPECVAQLLPDDLLTIHIEPLNNNTRRLTLDVD